MLLTRLLLTICENRNETITKTDVETILNYDAEFQS